MKFFFYLFICFLIAIQNNSKAQGYIPMDTITDWKVHVSSFGGTVEFWYYYAGDTVIHGKSYRIIKLEGSPDFVNLYFRENKTTRKVYKYLPNQDQEILFYDFGLALGDDFFVEYESGYFKVVDIDSVPSSLGPLKRWWFEKGFLQFTYIEAIGSDPLDYQYRIHISDPVYNTICGYHYCEKIFGDESCSPPPYRAITIAQAVSICEGQNYLGHELPGSYADTLITQNGCDSILLTNLNVIPPVNISIDTTICEGDTFHGINISGSYSFSFLSHLGCDSIVTYIISVIPLPELIEFYALCPGEEVHGISVEGIYSFLLPSKTDCDTVLTLVITELPVEDPSCITAINDQVPAHINIYPNPVTEYLHIETDLQIIEVDILDLHGHRLMHAYKLNPGNKTLDVSNLVPGVYILQMKGIHGSIFQKIVKL
ncbi:MAG TPA: T9SS type A sorting domain-containing protein [Saprospiraceae bacterium]|nr:T9SS type A sorting domain-containing protein [Saprospiraceae bacterium]